MKLFWNGFFAGAAAVVIIIGVIFALWFYHQRDRELIKYVERQKEIEALRTDYVNRDPAEFFEVPGVRGAADGAVADFERKRVEALQRFRSGLVD